MGTFAVQMAKVSGAEVTGVCSARNVDLVRAIGADHVIDYTREDFTQGGQRYDLIFDAAGTHSLSATRRALASNGTRRGPFPRGVEFLMIQEPPFAWLHVHPGLAAPFVVPEFALLRKQICFFPKVAAPRMEGRMKAIVYGHYGSPEVLELKDIGQPVPGDDEVLVKVCAASINPLDWHFMRGTPYLLQDFIIAGTSASRFPAMMKSW